MERIKLTKEDFKKRLDDFIDGEIMDEKAMRTYRKYETICHKFIDFFDDGEIAKKDLIAYKTSLKSKYKIKTVNNYLIIINRFIKYVELSLIDGDGFDRRKTKRYASNNTLKLEKEQQRLSVDNVLEPNEYKRMLRMAKKLKMMDMYHIMKTFAYTGIRISELQYFTVESLNDGDGYLTITNKGKTREIPIRGDLKRNLLKYAKSVGIESGKIFLINEDAIRYNLKKIAGKCRGISLKKVHPHSFRHMFGLEWVEQNGQASISELASIMGHSDVNTTAIYTQTSKKDKKRKLNKLKY